MVPRVVPPQPGGSRRRPVVWMLSLLLAAAVVCAVLAVVLDGVLLVVPSVVLVLLAVALARGYRHALGDVQGHNEAVERLARDPQRASEARVALRPRRHGLGSYVNAGEVTYTGADGRERTVPLTTSDALAHPVADEDLTSDSSACVVWHAADHTVVLTRILLG